MEGESTLQLIAELAIGVMGFSGIVAVLGRRASGAWTSLDRARFTTMVGHTVFVLFLSLFPLALFHTGLPEGWVWRTSSGAGAIVAVILLIVLPDSRAPATLRQHTVLDFRTLWLDPDVSNVALIYGAGVMVAVPVVLGLNAFGLILTQEVGPYLVAVFLQFGWPIVLFVRLLQAAISSQQG